MNHGSVSLEQRAHDLAIVLCHVSLEKSPVECSDAPVFEFVKMYEHFYKYALQSFEDIQ